MGLILILMFLFLSIGEVCSCCPGGLCKAAHPGRDGEGSPEMQRKQDTGVQVKHLLNLDKYQWDYYLDLARVGRFTPPQPVFESLYEDVRRQRQKDPQKYRQNNYRLIDATQWELLEAPPEQTDWV